MLLDLSLSLWWSLFRHDSNNQEDSKDNVSTILSERGKRSVMKSLFKRQDHSWWSTRVHENKGQNDILLCIVSLQYNNTFRRRKVMLYSNDMLLLFLSSVLWEDDAAALCLWLRFLILNFLSRWWCCVVSGCTVKRHANFIAKNDSGRSTLDIIDIWITRKGLRLNQTDGQNTHTHCPLYED